jgi:hypothetical protein
MENFWLSVLVNIVRGFVHGLGFMLGRRFGELWDKKEEKRSLNERSSSHNSK